MLCILTGFDAFDNQPSNPSQQAVELVADKFSLGHRKTQVEVRKATLPTCCAEAWKNLRKIVSKIPADEPFALVMAGVATTRDKISLERFALNVRDYRIADNRGHRWPERPIVAGAPDALRSQVSLGKLRERLNELALRAEVSYHAGTFVCNETYYRALNEWASDKRCQGIVFVHLPSPEAYVHVLTGVHQFISVNASLNAAIRLQAAAEATTIQQFALALSETIKFICRQPAVRKAPARRATGSKRAPKKRKARRRGR